MTNKEKYKQAFSVLHTSDDFLQEVEKMALLKKKQRVNIAVAAIIGLIMIGGTSTAYAANIGGIQRTVQLWIHGDQTDATMEIKADGSYEIYIYAGYLASLRCQDGRDIIKIHQQWRDRRSDRCLL